MEVKKGRWHQNKKGEFAFCTVSYSAVNVNAVVRDWILPHSHISVSVTDDGYMVLRPTNDENAYKFTVLGGQGRFSGRIVSGLIEYRQGVRYECIRREDGSILCKTGGF